MVFELKDQIGSAWAAIWGHVNAAFNQRKPVIREKVIQGQTRGEKQRNETIKTGR